MVKFNEGRSPVEGLLSEGDFHYSRETVMIASGAGILSPGSVLGRITASGKYTLSPDTGDDGSQTAAAILLYPVDATSADQQAVVVTRHAQWNVNTLIYHSTVNDATKRATKATQLEAAGIVVR